MSNKNPWGIPYLTGSEIRQSFIDFFVKEKGHQFVPSSPVVPHDDPTLLFINSGMNQFKALFLGDSSSDLKRAVNSQKCLRVSGKHNDLDEVGRDTYHHTFFEMLGNWSFGDYYKKEALVWSWELLTQVWKLPKDRLFATVYLNDDEAEEIWRTKTDINPKHILRFGEKSNFWEMGEVGPCGPCSEIHFDMGDLGTQSTTFADPTLGVNGPNARYIEIWNNVFMQYERVKDGSLKPLKSRHVDTGMGFERICSIIQGSGSNYETDLFQPILGKIAQLTGVSYHSGPEGTPHRVIADHLRALTFAIADGATPGNEGRGYVLRRILRRASRFSQELHQKDPFIFKLVPVLVQIMGNHFPEIKAREDFITAVIESEESRFMRTLRDGMSRFHKIVGDLKKQNLNTVSGQEVFQLYDTYGFPADLTGILASEKGLTIDQAGFDNAMNEQKERARSSAKFSAELVGEEGWTYLNPSHSGTLFVGYDQYECESTVTRFREHGDELLIVMDKSPFYPESGGQVGDIGNIISLNEAEPLHLKVIDTFKLFETQIHRCLLISGLVNKNSLTKIHAKIDEDFRKAVMRHHSATHLLHAGLRGMLGEHVTQQGSRVGADSLRFDFTHPKSLNHSELEELETLINRQILENLPVSIRHSQIDEAKSQGALALFGEKYSDHVRHIKMGVFSHELCGGTHVAATGEIGSIKILSESSIASGIRRIEAVAGMASVSASQEERKIILDISKYFKSKPSDIMHKLSELDHRMKDLEKSSKILQGERLKDMAKIFYSKKISSSSGIDCLILSLSKEKGIKDQLHELTDILSQEHHKLLTVLTHSDENTLSIFVSAGNDARKIHKAGDLAKILGEVAGGKGGGRPDRAQAGSKNPSMENAVLAKAHEILVR
jgi:alanyl-tRNA synthetase